MADASSSHQRKARTRLLLLLALLTACLPLGISGSTVPTEHTFRLTADDIAAAESTECEQKWVTGNLEADLAAAYAQLDVYGVKIKEGNPSGFHMALRRTLWMKPGFSKEPDFVKVVKLSHEFTHYCQRKEMGDRAFEKSTLHSAGRFRVETAAYAQDFRTMLIYCVHEEEVEAAMLDRLAKFRDGYWLWDIDPEQYEAEALRIWLKEFERAPACEKDARGG